MTFAVDNRAGSHPVALETTLVVHGVPRDSSLGLARQLSEDVRGAGAAPILVGVLSGRAVAGLTEAELHEMLDSGHVPKANSSNLGLLMHRGSHGATTVSATMEIAAGAGIRVFATGGLGGVHHGLAERLDISADLAAMAKFGVAVVSSGVKSLLDVESTREVLEALGVPVVGFQTDRFPAFYRRESDADVDARFDEVQELASYIAFELRRTGRGILVCNPVPASDEVPAQELAAWMERARKIALERGASGRRVTPLVLGAMHEVSGGRTLAANIALARSNAVLAGRLARALPD